MSIYKGTQLISGVVTPTEPTRNLGQKIESDFQLVDAGLHKPDGSLINGSGIYAPFVQAMASLSESSPESFCTEQEWQASVTAHGMCDKYVYDSTNNTVRLPKRSSAHGNLIDSYSSGTNWYRVYSDGWCEQGGRVTTTSSINVKFLRAFVNTNYEPILTVGESSAVDVWGDKPTVITSSLTTSSMDIYLNPRSGGYPTRTVYWQASGYIDISTYQQKPLYEYIVIATKIKSETEVDFDNLATELQNKVDKASLVEIPAIIETYRNGTSWYRVYSDGWCEQGGIIPANQTSVSLLKSYLDTNYSVLMVGANYGGSDQTLGTSSRTTSNFVVSTSSYQRFWRACGYIS